MILSEEFRLHKPLYGLLTVVHVFSLLVREKKKDEIFASIINPSMNQYRLLINEK